MARSKPHGRGLTGCPLGSLPEETLGYSEEKPVLFECSCDITLRWISLSFSSGGLQAKGLNLFVLWFPRSRRAMVIIPPTLQIGVSE